MLTSKSLTSMHKIQEITRNIETKEDVRVYEKYLWRMQN